MVSGMGAACQQVRKANAAGSTRKITSAGSKLVFESLIRVWARTTAYTRT